MNPRNGDERGVALTEQPDNAWSNIGAVEQAARDAAVARENRRSGNLDMLIEARARQLKDEPPPPDRQRGLDATRAARTRSAWAAWHREQAERHRAALTDLVAHHEAEAERLGGAM